MKKYSIFKIVQLSIVAVISLVGVFLLLQPDVKQFVFASRGATILFGVCWISLVASFVFLLMDFSFISSVKLNYHNLYGVAYSDPLSGMPNRFSCDTLIEKYIDATLPDDVGCVMIDLTNLPAINTKYDHTTGNRVLKDFSNVLSTSALSLCFVGRNGGNKFLAMFENCNDEKLNTFLGRVEERVNHYNASPDTLSMEYSYGVALNSEERLTDITKLISLANKRIYEDS